MEIHSNKFVLKNHIYGAEDTIIPCAQPRREDVHHKKQGRQFQPVKTSLFPKYDVKVQGDPKTHNQVVAKDQAKNICFTPFKGISQVNFVFPRTIITQQKREGSFEKA